MAEGATEEGWGKRAVQSWATRHSYPTDGAKRQERKT